MGECQCANFISPALCFSVHTPIPQLHCLFLMFGRNACRRTLGAHCLRKCVVPIIMLQENAPFRRRRQRRIRQGALPLPSGGVGERQGRHQQPGRGPHARGRVLERQPRRPVPQVSYCFGQRVFSATSAQPCVCLTLAPRLDPRFPSLSLALPLRLDPPFPNLS